VVRAPRVRHELEQPHRVLHRRGPAGAHQRAEGRYAVRETERLLEAS
jgi:hypothetical protein